MVNYWPQVAFGRVRPVKGRRGSSGIIWYTATGKWQWIRDLAKNSG